MNIKDNIESIFGSKALDHGLFYQHSAGLRFELSEGESYIEMFMSAYTKAQKILQYAFQGSHRITVCLAYYGENKTPGDLSSLKGLEDCEITIKNPEFWEKPEPEDNIKRIFIAYTANKEEINEVLWGVLATELGVMPRLGCSAYFIDLENQIIASPYDDRGMDVIGPNKQRLQMLYTKYNKFLLKHDLKTMRKYYQ